MTVLAAGVRFVDVGFRDLPGVIATAVIEGPSGVTLIDPGPASALPRLLRELQAIGVGLERVERILLTHIHLDHAGASGSLVARNPRIVVHVHERGAPHLIDPTKLLASASRLYGDAMDELWGPFEPVPSTNVRSLAGGEVLESGDRRLKVAYTPGHASHHVCYFEAASRIAFVGDVGGVKLEVLPIVVPPTPPPDIDLEAWRASIDRVLAWRPDALFMTHFGLAASPVAHMATLVEQLESFADRARALMATDGSDEERANRFAEGVGRELRGAVSDADVRRFETAVPFDHCWLGLSRYWRKRGVGAP